MAEPITYTPGDLGDLASYFAARAVIATDAATRTDDALERRDFEACARTWTLAAAVVAGMTAIPAITLWEPWATLVAAGAKPYEFRKWPAPVRLWGRRIAIHAGARPVRRAEVDDLLATLRLEGGWGTALRAEPAIEILLRVQADPKCLPLSHVLCTAILGKPLPADKIELERLATNGFAGDSNRIDHQMFGWPLTEIEPLMPLVPARGAQGFWHWQLPAGESVHA